MYAVSKQVLFFTIKTLFFLVMHALDLILGLGCIINQFLRWIFLSNLLFPVLCSEGHYFISDKTMNLNMSHLLLGVFLKICPFIDKNSENNFTDKYQRTFKLLILRYLKVSYWQWSSFDIIPEFYFRKVSTERVFQVSDDFSPNSKKNILKIQKKILAQNKPSSWISIWTSNWFSFQIYYFHYYAVKVTILFLIKLWSTYETEYESSAFKNWKIPENFAKKGDFWLLKSLIYQFISYKLL